MHEREREVEEERSMHGVFARAGQKNACWIRHSGSETNALPD